MIKIARVYGKADNYNLTFDLKGDTWVASVPSDLEDGQYVLELWAENYTGTTSYYTGMLYLCKASETYVEMELDDVVVSIASDRIFFEQFTRYNEHFILKNSMLVCVSERAVV